ncbi:MAG TPA: PQQ-binding-like beta-propeller repeat protein [Acidimicrobiales bacterium]|nr:PQQ-binding-like beta-propeller repeat protein [Acidimicrobiales bacterium]
MARVVGTPGRRASLVALALLAGVFGSLQLSLHERTSSTPAAASGLTVDRPTVAAPSSTSSTAGTSAAGQPAAPRPTLGQTWSVSLDDAGGPIAESSPIVAQLPGGPAAVVGDRKGELYAYYLAGSAATPVPGWPYYDGGVPIDSTPSVASLSGPGDTVYVGEGNAFDPLQGGYAAISPTGHVQWFATEHNPPTDPYGVNGVQASLAVGNLRGATGVVAGSLGQEEDALDAASGALLPGFPWIEADSNFSTPALADLYRNGVTEIVEGGASTAGLAYERHYSSGGHLRVLSPAGNAGKPLPNQGQDCEYDTNQEVDSSPAVGEFLGPSQAVGIVVGTGSYYAGASQTNQLLAFNTSCQVLWSDTLAGLTSSSPALADVLGNGQLQVVEGTNNGANGTVYVLDGPTGHVDWQANVPAPVYGSVVTADLFGNGQDVLVPTTSGVDIFTGTGQLITTLAPWCGFQNSPLVTDDPNGTVGITLAGYNGSNQGEIFHYEITGAKGSNVAEKGSWPMFHHDPQLTGNAGTAYNPQVPCSAPAVPGGYWEVGADGGIFSFGNAPYCGSTSGMHLASPVVTMAPTRDRGGYWLVSSDGGVYAFGDARFLGAMGEKPIAAPVVGMAVTPDGGGYWLVSSDGGVYAFGDARYIGSMGEKPIAAPVVGLKI